ncbi:Fe-S cluster assembly ATPase SufC [Irregularibacter muris]|uniref:Fe-S cluster assembly ATPase SufC n=1 Tax=Irregularibacter muris TaxID=1796619 RepID=A0AAE3L431_9FIRM|nr:Fe-S cluster assembly ATPase SufC [Irregularibacter muris]MCR1899343.1 Fe-S cluster assembly ATPase SufC [Irregularibacter muris]
MKDTLLKIQNIKASVEDKEILKGINLTINKGEVHVIMGPNGAGKSTLANVLMNHPNYKVGQGEIFFKGEDITHLQTDERARRGMFLSFQYPEEVPGITVENFLRTAKASISGKPVRLLAFKKALQEKMELLDMKPEYAQRYLNEGFSGGEKKKNEILQMTILEPDLAILDETDSGLDVDAVKVVSQGIQMYSKEDNAVLIITHHKKLLEHIKPDFVHILLDGKISMTSDSSLVDKIEAQGYQWVREGRGE